MMDTREAVARAIAEAECGRITENELARCLEIADAAIAAHLKALADAGLIVVPREPTEAMCKAGSKLWGTFVQPVVCGDVYRTMIQAATPSPHERHGDAHDGGAE